MCKCSCKTIPSIRVKKLFPNAVLPQRAESTASGLDVCIYRFENLFHEVGEVRDISLTSVILKPNDRVLINTGLAATVAPGFEIQVRPRSGNALKRGLIVVNSPGTVDYAYRGAIYVIISNCGHQIQELKIGERIAQLVVCPVTLSQVVEVEELDETERGGNGLGSTGL